MTPELVMAMVLAAGTPAPKLSTAATWRTDYAAALVEAKQSGRLVFVKVRTDPCIWCDHMERGPLKDAAVIKALSGLVTVSLDTEHHAAEIGRMFPQTVFPRYVIKNGDGKTLRSATGYTSVADLLRLINGPPPPKLQAPMKTMTVLGHSHRCPYCGNEWSHTSASRGSLAAHTCSECGKTLPLPWHPYQTSVPVSVPYCPPGKR